MGRGRNRQRDAPAYVESWPLRALPRQRASVEARFGAGLRVYNACLGEALRRSAQVKADPAWVEAREMLRGTKATPEAKARSEAFDEVNNRHGFTLAALQSYGSGLRQNWVRERYHLGSAGRPRFEPWRRGLHSMETKIREGSLRPVLSDEGIPTGLQWGQGFVLDIAAAKTETESVELVRLSRAVQSGWRRARIVKTVIGGRATWRAQFVCDGRPPARDPRASGRVSIDLGPSMADVVSGTGSFTVPLADSLAGRAAELRRQQRHSDRQHRAGSPGCLNPDGTHVAGRCHWQTRSKSARRTQAKVADLHRQTAAHRLSTHGRIWNRLQATGVDARAGKLNYVAWQKMFPRSARDRAPGLFVEMGRRKAASAGGSFYEYSPYTTALSQTCVCGGHKDKRLSERVHRCACGVVAPRDRFSAFLGLHVHPVVDPETGELRDLLDVEEAHQSLLDRHDIGGHPASGSTKLRGSRRWWHPRHPRAVARRRARLNPGGDRAVRGKPTQPVPTAGATTAEAVAA
ncbi:MAG: transposase [Actinomycetota bacterium]|jgi:hypothetical protein|nr:transposase [Actinomycetota bacterium]